MHKASHQPVLDDIAEIRRSRHDAAVLEYRQIVETISAGDAKPVEFGNALDDIMVRLNISDDDLASDVEAMREVIGCRERLAEFEPKRAEVQKRRDEAKAEVEKLEQEHKSWDMRRARAMATVQEIGAPFQVAQRDTRRIDKLELGNPRLFGEITDG